MDKSRSNRFSWLPAEMPGVARRIAALRAELGADHVNECWKRGVIDAEPGWFWAAEGPLMVGTLWPELLDDPVLRHYVMRSDANAQASAMVVLKPKAEAAHGTH